MSSRNRSGLQEIHGYFQHRKADFSRDVSNVDGQNQPPSSDPAVSRNHFHALSYALDLTEGVAALSHSGRACMMGMRLAQQTGMSQAEQADLYYALLLKDAGCSSNASRLFHILNADEIRAKGDVKTTDWTRVEKQESLHYALTHVATGMPFLQRMQRLFQVAATQQQDSCSLVTIRCERGSYIAKQLGFSNSVAEGIYNLDEHWNGRGYPDGRRKEEIPLFSRIANLAQTLDVFLTAHGPEVALEAAKKRSGRWFDPDLVKAAASLANSGALWDGLDDPNLHTRISSMEPEFRRIQNVGSSRRIAAAAGVLPGNSA